MIWQQFKPTLCATVPYGGIEGACGRDGEPVPYRAARRDDVGIVPYGCYKGFCLMRDQARGYCAGVLPVL